MPTLAQQGLRVMGFNGEDRRLIVRATGNEPYMSGRSILGLLRALEIATQEELEVSTALHRRSADNEPYMRLVFSSTQLFDKSRHQQLVELLAHYDLPELTVPNPNQPPSTPDVLFTTRTGQVMLNPLQTFNLGQIMAWAQQLTGGSIRIQDIAFGLRSEYPCFEAEATTSQQFTDLTRRLWPCRYPYGATIKARATVSRQPEVPSETLVFVFTDRELSPAMLQSAHHYCDRKVEPQVSINDAGDFRPGGLGEALRLRVATVNNHEVADKVVMFLRYLGIQPIGTMEIRFDRYTLVQHTFRAYDAPPPEQGSATTSPTPRPDADPARAVLAADQTGATGALPKAVHPVAAPPVSGES